MKNQLKRNLTLLDVFCLASGAMISSGIFILPGLAFSHAGPLVFLSYLFAGIGAFLGTLSVIELSTAMPKAGGDYYFITRSLGPMVGTVSSFLSWIALCLKSAFAIFGISEVLYITFGLPIILSAFFLCIFFTVLNIVGVKEAARFEVILVIGLFMIMAVLIIAGIGKLNVGHFVPALPYGINKVFVTAGFVFISFGGLLNIASVSGEIRTPSKNIPLGMILSLAAVTIFYTLILIVAVGVLSGEKLSTSLTPIADTGRLLLGQTGYVIVSIGALLAFITTANAGVLSASRYPLALSKDKLLPGMIGRLSKRKESPFVAISITGLFIFVCMLLDLATLVKLGSVAILTLYILTNVAVVVLREGNIQNYKPTFKVPFYPWINIASIALFIFLIIDMGLVAIEESVVLICAALMLYFFYGRKKHSIGYAFIHLIEKIVNRRMTDSSLEEELKQVVIQRDDLKIDRFHRLIEDAIIWDIEEKLNYDDFLKFLAKKTAKDINLSNEKIIELLKQRESEGSTAITPFVAIPHIIIPGQNKFKLAILRCRSGIKFSHEHDYVKAIFVLFGTIDERSFHLQVLATIAHIVQAKDFEKAWMNARNKQQLRDMLLLSERKR